MGGRGGDLDLTANLSRHGRGAWPGRRPAKIPLWQVAALAIGAIGASMLGLSAYVAYRMARPARASGEEEPPEGSYEKVRFPSADGLRLDGWFLSGTANAPAVILCHGFHTGRREMLSLATALRDRGYHVLTFDFRGHGASDGRWTSCGSMEPRDLEGAVRYMLSRPEVVADRVGVIGFSMGGAVAILTAARVPEIGALVADSSFASLKEVASCYFRRVTGLPAFPFANLALWFGERLVGARVDSIRPMDAIAAISPRPVFLIHGTEDRIVPLAEAYLLFESAGEPRELWTVAGADHVEARSIDLQGYVDRVDRFLRRYLASPAEAARLETTADGSPRS